MSSECMEKGKLGDRVHRINVLAEAEDDAPICWVCLDHASLDRPLIHPCKCPSWCHSTCIARWQLQSAGTRREKYCDFCSSELPDWKSVLTPTPGVTAPAVMNVNFDNKTYSFQVAPGADGYRQFTEAIRKAFHLPDDSELNITFTCDEPSSGSLLTLSGPGAYDAAVHCASVSAARRSISGEHSSSSSSGAASPSFLQQQRDVAFRRDRLRDRDEDQDDDLGLRDQDDLGLRNQGDLGLRNQGDLGLRHDYQARVMQYDGLRDDVVVRNRDQGGLRNDSAAAAARGSSSSRERRLQYSVRRSSSSPDLHDLIMDHAPSSSSSSGSSNLAAAAAAAGDATYSPASTVSSDEDHQAVDQTDAAAAASDAAAATATHYDPSASPPMSDSGRVSISSRLSDSGSEYSSSDGVPQAAAAARGVCSRTLSSASTSSAASSSAGSSSSSSSSGRRGSGFGKKLRDAISELLISK